MILYFVMKWNDWNDWEECVDEFTQHDDAMMYAQKMTEETGVAHTVLVSE